MKSLRKTAGITVILILVFMVIALFQYQTKEDAIMFPDQIEFYMNEEWSMVSLDGMALSGEPEHDRIGELVEAAMKAGDYEQVNLPFAGMNDSNDHTPLALGVLSMGEDGELRVLEAPKVETTALMTVDDQVNTGLIEALKEDYRVLNEESNDYVEALVARTFCPLASTMESNVDREQEVANYNSYLEFYRESKDAFIKTVKPLIEKLLGIWCYFEQYPKKLKGMRPSMLITNTSN